MTFDGKIRYLIYESILELEFKSSAFHNVMEKAKSLLHNKSGFIWKKLDILYKWIEWTKNGIPPENLKNEYYLFNNLKVKKAIKDVSKHLIDHLIKDEKIFYQSLQKEPNIPKEYHPIHSLTNLFGKEEILQVIP